MPLPRYERQRDGLGPRQRRLFLYFFGFAIVLGFVVGVIWIVAGLIHFHLLQ